MLSKRFLVLLLVLSIMIMPTLSVFSASNYPNKPITIITRQAGGGADVALRVVQPGISKALGTNVIVENVDGGAGAIAIQELFKRPADGYTFGCAYVPTFIVFELINNHKWKTKETVWVANLTRDFGCVLVVPKKSSIKSWKDIEKIAQKRPITIAGSGTGSVTDFQRFFLQDAFPNIKFTYIPFNSGGEAATAMAGGHTDLGIAVLSNVGQMEKEGLVRFLAFFRDERLKDYPNVPTIKEFSGKAVDPVSTQIVLFAPPGTPDYAVKAMNEAVRKTLKDPGVIEKYKGLGNDAYHMTPEELKTWIFRYWDNINKIKDNFKK